MCVLQPRAGGRGGSGNSPKQRKTYIKGTEPPEPGAPQKPKTQPTRSAEAASLALVDQPRAVPLHCSWGGQRHQQPEARLRHHRAHQPLLAAHVPEVLETDRMGVFLVGVKRETRSGTSHNLGGGGGRVVFKGKLQGPPFFLGGVPLKKTNDPRCVHLSVCPKQHTHTHTHIYIYIVWWTFGQLGFPSHSPFWKLHSGDRFNKTCQ